MLLRDTVVCASTISGCCTAAIAKYWQYFVRWYSEYCEYSEYQNALNMQYDVYSDHLCAVSMIHPHLLQKTYTDGPTSGSWSKLFSGRTTGVLEHTGSISGLYTPRTQSIYGFNALDTLSTPSISDVCTAGTACTRGCSLLEPQVLAVSGQQYC